MSRSSIAQPIRLQNRFVQPRELQGQSFSSCASAVEKFAVRAANTLIKGQGVFLTRRETRGDRATPASAQNTAATSAAILDQRKRRKPPWRTTTTPP